MNKNFKNILPSIINIYDTLAIFCKTKEEAKELANLLDIEENNFSAFFKKPSYPVPTYNCFDCCLIKNGNVIGFGAKEHLDRISCYINIYDFSFLKNEFNKRFSHLDFKVGDLVEDIKHDTYGVILDIVSEDEVYIYTDNGCVELWEKELLINTGEKKDLSFLKVDRPNELEL